MLFTNVQALITIRFLTTFASFEYPTLVISPVGAVEQTLIYAKVTDKGNQFSRSNLTEVR